MVEKKQTRNKLDSNKNLQILVVKVSLYLLVEGHMSWDEVFILAVVKGAISNVWCLKGQFTDLLLDQLVR